MSSPIRLFVPAELTHDARIAPTAGQAHYLSAVMRRSVGAELTLFNGRDGEWRAHISELRKDRGAFTVAHRLREQASEPDLWLVFAALKHGPTDLVVQKATELGASRIMPVMTERTNTSRINRDRLAAIAAEAAEQCERLSVPDVRELRGLRDTLADWPPDRPLFAAVERTAAAALRAVDGAAALLVGPEGGFTEAELDALAAHAFVRTASLGPRILRAETAAIVGLALLQAHSGG